MVGSTVAAATVTLTERVDGKPSSPMTSSVNSTSSLISSEATLPEFSCESGISYVNPSVPEIDALLAF